MVTLAELLVVQQIVAMHPEKGFFCLPSISTDDKNCLNRGAIYGYQESVTKI